MNNPREKSLLVYAGNQQDTCRRQVEMLNRELKESEKTSRKQDKGMRCSGR